MDRHLSQTPNPETIQQKPLLSPAEEPLDAPPLPAQPQDPLEPLATKSRPTRSTASTRESLLTGMMGSAPSHSAAFLTFTELYWASARTVLNLIPRRRTRSRSGSKWTLSFSLHGATVKARGSSEIGAACRVDAIS